MNKFAGTITFSWEVDLSKLNYKNLVSLGDNYTTVFVFWDTKFETSKALLEDFEKYWEQISYDVSISTEDKITMMNTDLDKDWLYESASFEWPESDIKNVTERFMDTYELICVRESENSEKFWNRIIRADFVY